MNNRFFLFIVLILLVPELLISTCHAASHSQTPQLVTDHEISQDSLENKIDALKSRTDLDEAQKNKLLGFYRAANENVRNDEWFQFLSKTYQEAIEQSAKKIKEQQNRVDNFQTQPTKELELFNQLSLEQLELRLTLEKTALNDLDTQIAKTENDLNLQEARATEIRQETEVAKQALEDNDKNSEIFKLLAETELEREARQLQTKTSYNKLTSQLKMLGLEAISQPARLELLKIQLQLLMLQKQALVPVMGEIERTLAQRQQLEAQSLKDKLLKIEKQSLHKHPAIQLLTKENIDYSLELQTLSAKLEKINQNKEGLEEKNLEIESDFKSAEKKITLAGLSPALGKILREQRYKLTSIDKFNKQNEYIQNQTALTSLAEFKLEDRLKELVDSDVELQRLMSTQVAFNETTRPQIEAELRQLLVEQKELLNKLTKAYATYLRSLGDYDFAKQQLLKEAGKYALYLDERLLWVPSSAPINKAYFVNLYDASQWLLSLSNWQKVAVNLLSSLLNNYLFTLIGMLLIACLIHYQQRLKKQITGIGIKVGMVYSDQFYLTFMALAYTLISILPWPLLVFCVGWLLENAVQSSDFSLAVANGLQNTAPPLFFLQLFYHVFAPLGIVEQHFHWQPQTTQILHRQIVWAQRVIVPAVFLMNMANGSKNTLHSDSLGRLALTAVMLVLMLVLARLLHPERGMLQTLIKEKPASWIARLRYVWYGSVIAIPLTVIGFAFDGYYLSALELEQKLIVTLRFSFVIVIVYELIVRWLTLVDRQLALKNAREKRKSALLNTQYPGSAEAENQAVVLLDIPKINQQTTKLLNVFISISLLTGFWIIWKNILPAFSFMDQMVLWQHLTMIDKQEALQAVTLGNLLLAGIYLFVMLIAVNNFPGLLEILIFSRFSFELGSRYATNQITRYMLIALGMIFIVNELGGSWTQVQWLVAALSVGLGFGLQEIFANFVSGIILLFERPIRVGDIVTIGDATGRVSQIQMRATRIVDADQKDVIVPNKSFITDKLVNWTLSNQITRLEILLRIAFGSDVEFAHQLMTETVSTTPLVLAEPKPEVFFLGFGDSSLDFSIRVHVSELGHRMLVTHDLHLRIYKALAENNIEIPFPQRDIHIRSSAPPL